MNTIVSREHLLALVLRRLLETGDLQVAVETIAREHALPPELVAQVLREGSEEAAK